MFLSIIIEYATWLFYKCVPSDFGSKRFLETCEKIVTYRMSVELLCNCAYVAFREVRLSNCCFARSPVKNWCQKLRSRERDHVGEIADCRQRYRQSHAYSRLNITKIRLFNNITLGQFNNIIYLKHLCQIYTQHHFFILLLH